MLCPLRLDIDLIGDGSPDWPLDEALVKSHCRVDFADEDTNLQLYLRAAIDWAEAASRRTIFARAHRWVLREFPATRYQEIRLPRGKTRSVTNIAYINGGVTTTLTGPTSNPVGTGYQEDLRGDSGGVLMPLRGQSWPSVDGDVPAPVVIEFVAGYQTDEIPDAIVSAILLATADAYDMRSSADLNSASLASTGNNLKARNALISAYDLTRWY